MFSKNVFLNIMAFVFIFSAASAQSMEVYSSGLERIESPDFRTGRRIAAFTSLAMGSIVLGLSIKNHEYTFKRMAVSSLLIVGGLFSFTTKELKIARPIYHKNHSLAQDTMISKFAFAFENSRVQKYVKEYSSITFSKKQEERDLDDENEEEVEEKKKTKKHHNSDKQKQNNTRSLYESKISIPIECLLKAYESPLWGKIKNEQYRSQQKPILARLPIIGVFLDGMLYNSECVKFFKATFNNGFNPFALGIWFLYGSWTGIQRLLKEEKTPEDKELATEISEIVSTLYFIDSWNKDVRKIAAAEKK